MIGHRAEFGLALAMLCFGCAQVRAPEGGAKDEAPPQLLSAEPPNRSLFFQGDRIELQFDERIRLNGVYQNVLISPPLKSKPVIQVQRGTRVVISGMGDLLPNTTYTVNFGEAIADLNEGNAASAFTYVFSTGAELDAIQINGKVLNAFTRMNEQGVHVLLHNLADTGDLRTTNPRYFARTNAQGDFHLMNLAPGRYHITALRDKNANYRFDLSNEEVAFMDKEMDLQRSDSLISGIELSLFLANAKTQFVKESRVTEDGALRIITSRSSEELKLRPMDAPGKELNFLSEMRPGSDTSFWWPLDTTALSGKALQLWDGERIIDTVRYRPLKKMSFGPQLRLVSAGVNDSADVVILSSKPITKVDSSRITLEQDSVRLPFHYSIVGVSNRKVWIQLDRPYNGALSILLRPKAIKDIYQGHNDTLRSTLGAVDEKNLGTIKMQIETPGNGQYVLQLVGPRGEIVQEQVITTTPHWQHWQGLRSGQYSVRSINDRNGNGQWDTGSFDDHTQPEPVFLYPEVVNVRAGWSLDLKWDLK